MQIDSGENSQYLNTIASEAAFLISEFAANSTNNRIDSGTLRRQHHQSGYFFENLDKIAFLPIAFLPCRQKVSGLVGRKQAGNICVELLGSGRFR